MRRARVRGAFLVLCGWALILASMALRNDGAPSPSDEERMESARLEQRVLLLEAELAAFRHVEGLAERFRATPFIGFSMLAARISTPFDFSPRRRSALIDAGSAEGVHAGDGVVAAEGIVGRIAAGEEQRSRVQLADDPEFRVEFQVVR